MITMPKIMLVDDDKTMIGLLKTLLEMDGFEVVSPHHQDRILETVLQERPDLILLDVYLEEVDGLEILKQIREQPELERVRIIVTSGMDVSDIGYKAGADRFLLKPYQPDRLTKMITQLLGENETDHQISSSQGVA
jgi:DNA-binding response OmpR family regulator